MSDPSLLHTGDVILLEYRLEDPRRKAFVCGNDVTGSSMCVFAFQDASAMSDIRDCLFKVVPPLSYHALKDLKAAEKNGLAAQDLYVFKEKLKLEKKQNEETMAMVEPVNYGDAIQLLHVKSNRFIRVHPRKTALAERRARCVEMGSGNPYAAFVVQPFYKFKYMGDVVCYNEQMLLQASKTGPQWFLHTQKENVKDGPSVNTKLHELNCSTELEGGFFPVLYARGSGFLRFSSMVRFFHTQYERLLGASSYCEAMEFARSSSERRVEQKRPFLRRLNEDNLDNSGNLWGKGAWLIEPLDIFQGGAVTWNSRLRVKHLGTGKYLAVDASTESGERMYSKLTDEPNDDAVFSFDPIGETETKEITLDQGRTRALLRYVASSGQLWWLTCNPEWRKRLQDPNPKPSLVTAFVKHRRIKEALRIEAFDESHADYATCVNQVTAWRSAMTGIINDFRSPRMRKGHTLTKNLEGDAAEGQTGPRNDERKKSIASTARRLSQRLQLDEEEGDKKQVFDRLEAILSSSIAFLTGENIEEVGDALQCAETSKQDRQMLVRELKYIDTLVACHHVMCDAGYRVTKFVSHTMVDLSAFFSLVDLDISPQKADPPTPFQKEIDTQEGRIMKLNLKLWRSSFMDNRVNETYFDRRGWTRVINNLNGLGLGAPITLSSLVNNNVEIAMRLGQDIIEKFAYFIAELGPDHNWLIFLRAVCSCLGQALKSRQQLVLRLMYNQGPCASDEEKRKWQKHRLKLLLSMEVGDVEGSFPEVLQQELANEFLGKDAVFKGRTQILVSWETNLKELWNLGKDWLYFHPQHLQLPVQKYHEASNRCWVSVSDLAWALCPDEMFPIVHPNLPNDAWKMEGQKSRFDALKVLSDFFLAQIKLLREMCLDRQMNCIRSLEKEYTFELIANALWNPLFAPQLRGAFCELCDTLWLDRFPHQEQQLPQLVYPWVNLEASLTLPAFEHPGNSSGCTGEFYTMRAATKFNMLLAYCRNHLEETQERMVYCDEGQCYHTSAVAKTLLNLLRFGFVSTTGQLSILIGLMIRVLDGRTDLLHVLPEDEHFKEAMKSSKASRSEREESNFASSLSFSNGIEEPLLTHSSSEYPCCGRAAAAREISDLPGDMTSTGGMPLYFAIPSEGGEERYHVQSYSESAVQAKRSLCKMCHTMLMMVHNSDAQAVLRGFYRSRDNVEVDTSSALRELVPFRSNFDKLGGASLNTILLDLMMYEDAEIFQTAMATLQGLNHRVAFAMESVGQIGLLCDSEEVHTYRRLKNSVSRLSDLVYTHEDWGVCDAFGPIDQHTYHEAKDILIFLRQMCSIGGEGNDSETQHKQNQHMLSNLGLGSVLMDTFQIDLNELDEQAQQELLDFMRLVCQLLVQFMNRNSLNQKHIFKQIHRLVSWFSAGVGVANVIAAMFIENANLSEQMPADLIYKFGQVLVQNREYETPIFKPHQLAFLQCLIVDGQRPVVRNKLLVLEMIRNPSYSKVLLLLDQEEQKTNSSGAPTVNPPLDRNRCSELLLNFSSWSELVKPRMFRKWHGNDAEIQYHNVSLELLATLCIGRDRSGATEFVQFLAPAKIIAADYLFIDATQNIEGGSSVDCKRMSRTLKKTLLHIIEGAYYDTELHDEEFLSSTIHFELLECVQLELSNDVGRMKKGEVTAVGERMMAQVVNTITLLLEYTEKKMWEPRIEQLMKEKYAPIMQELCSPTITFKTLNDALFKSAVTRALALLKGQPEDMQTQTRQRLQSKASSLLNESESAVVNARLQNLTMLLLDCGETKESISQEHAQLIMHIANIANITNPASQEYQHEKLAAQRTWRRMRIDFRRNEIKLEEVVRRLVNHCLQGNNLKDNATTSSVIETICGILEYCRSPSLLLQRHLNETEGVEPIDAQALYKMQLKIANCGGVILAVKTLMSKPESDIAVMAIQLAIQLLEPFNKGVQNIFEKLFHTLDDWVLFDTLRGFYTKVESNVKNIRVLKRMQRSIGTESMIESEMKLIRLFEDDLQTVATCMHFLELLCAGNNITMQGYIFRQVDNTSSFNFVERTGILAMKICKNEKAADDVDETEIKCFLKAMSLLLGLSTGPEPRNQNFLSTSGLVENITKVLASQFGLLRRLADGDCYPAIVRKTKAQCTMCLLGMLELRSNAEVHRNILYRIDDFRLKSRLVFIHRWFLSKYIIKHSHGSATPPHKIGESGTCLLDSQGEDDGITIPDESPEVLLESFGESDLSDMFDEAFIILMVMRELSAYSEKFRDSVVAHSVTFEDDPSLYLSAHAYEVAKHQYQQDLKYNASFNFFDHWINTIEVVVDGHVYDAHFRMPLVCNFVLGRTKVDIMNTVKIDSPEDKARDFVEQCSAAYSQTLHTRVLSEWTPPIMNCDRRYLPRPLNFFLKNDSQNLTLSSQVALGVAALINVCLAFGLELESSDGVSYPAFRDSHLESTVTLLGMLYLLMLLTALIVTIVTYSPLDYRAFREASKGSPARWRVTMGCVSTCLALGVGSILFQRPFGALLGLFSLYFVSSNWKQGNGTNCPNNVVARFFATFAKGLDRGEILRYAFFLMLVIIGLSGEHFIYSMLLLDLLFLSQVLQDVTKAVTIPAQQLATTGCMAIIILYEFAVMAFYFFRDDYQDRCNGMVDCMTTTIYLGLRMDLGTALAPVSVAREGDWYPRMAFDLTFWIVITTITMTVIIGIIIDTFGMLRDENQTREGYFKNTTFIACIERPNIDKVANIMGLPNGWDHLENAITGKQAPWKYLNFMFYLQHKDPAKFTGAETKINALMIDGDVAWLPLGTCKVMQSAQKAAQEEEGGIDKRLNVLSEKVDEVLTRLAAIENNDKSH